MNKEALTQAGLTPEQVEAVWQLFDGKYVHKDRFNEANTGRKAAQEALQKSEAKLAALEGSADDASTLQGKLATAQQELDTLAQRHAAEMKALRLDSAVNAALQAARAKNPATVKPLLQDFLANAEMDGNAVKGLEDELKRLTEDKSTSFLFEDKQGAPAFKGLVPGERRDALPLGVDTNPFDAKTRDVDAQMALFKSDPETARALAKQTGVLIP